MGACAGGTSALYLTVRELGNYFFPTTSRCYRIDEIIKLSLLITLPCKASREKLSYCMHSVRLDWVCMLPCSGENTLRAESGKSKFLIVLSPDCALHTSSIAHLA
jgi:hypothetical protein